MTAAFAGNAIFGLSFLFSKLALNVAEPMVLLVCRFMVAFLLMSVLILSGKVPFNIKGRKIGRLLLLGFFQPCIYFVCESYGIRYTSSSFAGILIALIPIAGLFLGYVILKEKPTLLQTLFSLLSVGGVLVMTVINGVGGFEMKGLLFLLGAVASGALFSVVSRSLASEFSAFERTYVMFAMGAVVFTIMAFVQLGFDKEIWLTPMKSSSFWISIIYLSCVSSVGAFMLLNKALEGLDVARSLVFANVTTVISVLAGVFVLHESFSLIQVLGIVMVMAGVIGVNVSEAKEKRAND